MLRFYLLVRQEGVALQGRQMTTEQSAARPVMLAKDGAIDVVKAVTGHQAISTCGTSETLWRDASFVKLNAYVSDA